MTERVRVNPVACTAYGLCAEWLPERIDLDEWGYAVVDQTPLTADLVAHARRAARECPVRALRLTQVPGQRRAPSGPGQ